MKFKSPVSREQISQKVKSVSQKVSTHHYSVFAVGFLGYRACLALKNGDKVFQDSVLTNWQTSARGITSTLDVFTVQVKLWKNQFLLLYSGSLNPQLFMLSLSIGPIVLILSDRDTILEVVLLVIFLENRFAEHPVLPGSITPRASPHSTIIYSLAHVCWGHSHLTCEDIALLVYGVTRNGELLIGWGLVRLFTRVVWDQLFLCNKITTLYLM